MKNKITVTGANQNNLKNISLEIPKNKFIVLTGVSGSGKSSLAFDTIYAEGQRRYVESLSSYARQFLGIMDKPNVEQIEGLSPAISIDQKTTSHNPRSTVGTTTETYDYLRLLYARIGHPHCPKCGKEISKLSIDEIVELVMQFIEEKTRENKAKPIVFKILSPVIRQKKGQHKDLLNNLISKGFTEAKIDNQKYDLTEEVNLIKTNKHTIQAIIDTISVKHKNYKDKLYQSNLRSRLARDIEQSLNLSDGLVIAETKKHQHLFSEKFTCSQCNISLEELEPRMFSFNSPIGACKTCNGLGVVQKIDPERILNPNLTVNQGGILPFNRLFFQDTWYTRIVKKVAKVENIPLDIPIKDVPQEKLKLLLYGTEKEYSVTGTNRHDQPTTIHEIFDGVIKKIEDKYYESKGKRTRSRLKKYFHEETCSSCDGGKLNQKVLSVTVDKINISDLTQFTVADLHEYLQDLPNKLNEYENKIAKNILKELNQRLKFLNDVGLSYLTLDRKAKTLSGGEAQRIRLASQIGTGLTGVLYVLDEPSIGLHPKDINSLINSLKHLTDIGNTLLIVEHDRNTIEAADHIIELGPKAGKHGGAIISQGTLSETKNNKKSLTGKYLSGKKTVPKKSKKISNKKGSLKLIGASQHNLKNINVSLPLGNLIGITGVSGSGKSTLINQTLYKALKYYVDGKYTNHMGSFKKLNGYQKINKVYLVDQSPIGRTPRSNPATYVGFFNRIRKLYAQTQKARLKGFKKGRFSFNVKGGRCEKCKGGGLIEIEMQFLPDVYVECDACKGKRYNQETLSIKYKGKSIYDILQLTVSEAKDFFHNHKVIHKKLKLLEEVGLGYIRLGQPAPTLSGGEAQRIKLAKELTRRQTGDTVYLLDEPTTGLHFYDISKLLNSLHKLVNKGNTVIVIEHNLDIIKNCQYLIDLGPGGGDKGGSLVFQGPTKNIINNKKSHTAKHLKKYF